MTISRFSPDAKGLVLCEDQPCFFSFTSQRRDQTSGYVSPAQARSTPHQEGSTCQARNGLTVGIGTVRVSGRGNVLARLTVPILIPTIMVAIVAVIVDLVSL